MSRAEGQSLKKMFPDRGFALQNEGGLSGVVEDKAREYQRRPGEADRPRPEVTHVGVKRLGARDAEKDAAEHQEAAGTAGEQVAQAIARIDRHQHGGVLRDPPDAEDRNGQEPERHDRPERPTDTRGALGLDREQPDQDGDCRRNHIGLDRRRRDVQAFERGKNRDRRRDGAIAVNQGRAEQAHGDDDGSPFALDAQERHEGEDAPLPIVVHPHGDRHIFDGRHDDQGPDDERQCPQGDVGVWVLAGEREDGLEGVERARPYVPEHDPERRHARERKAGRGRGAVAPLMYGIGHMKLPKCEILSHPGARDYRWLLMEMCPNCRQAPDHDIARRDRGDARITSGGRRFLRGAAMMRRWSTSMVFGGLTHTRNVAANSAK